jgi:hypothetical protein
VSWEGGGRGLFDVLSQNLYGEPEKTHEKNLSQDSRDPGKDSSLTPCSLEEI